MSSETRLRSKIFGDMSHDSKSGQDRKNFNGKHNVRLLPHLLQNKHSRFLPDAVFRVYTAMAFEAISKGGNMAEIPKAEEL